MRHVVFEGLPAAGKSETLSLLARFYPQRVVVLPELVKEVATRDEIDIFSQRDRLTEAIVSEVPRRKEQVERAIASGKLCLEESHLGVHLAYAKALGDNGFIEAYQDIASALPQPDAYVRLDIPIELSLLRQEARNTPSFFVDKEHLETMLTALQRWHIEHLTNLITIDADREPSSFLAEIERTLKLEYVNEDVPLDDTFDIILLLGRPAAGKSEFIDFMHKTPIAQRARDYHIAPFEALDDFPILWEKCVEDDLWESMGKERLYSRRAEGNYAITNSDMWEFLIRRLGQQVNAVISTSGALADRTLIVEFARGGSRGYTDAFSQLSPEILKRAVILYVSVSFEESWRRNVARYDEKKRSGLLTHSVPRAEMEATYGIDDWFDIAHDPHGTMTTQGIEVPYATMNNEPESKDPRILGPRYAAALDELYSLWKRRQPR
ncbi:MAG TPA: hypothetical protein ENL23_04675 [Candidatus Acetothermia bacterium]|nr:hypothetical protein [Candidatus Acetothermia bacterium]